MTCEQNKLLHEINILSFTVVELNLFLDTHPCNQEAMRHFDYYNRLKKEKCEEYSNMFGPLTLKDAKGRTQEFQWTMQPWPWEGGCE